jgi:hypothetical protein
MKTKQDFMEVIDAFRESYKNNSEPGFSLDMEIEGIENENFDTEMYFDQNEESTKIIMFSHGLMLNDACYISYDKIIMIMEI